MNKDIVSFIKNNTSSSVDDILRCLTKSYFIIFHDDLLFVADDKYIYYFIIEEKKRKTKYAKEFYDMCYPYMKNKLFFSKNISLYKHHCIEIENYVCKEPNNKLYRWI